MDREAGAGEGAQAATNTGAGGGAPDASGGNDAHGVPGATPDASSDSQQEQDIGGDWQTRMSRRRRYRASRQARHDSAASTASASTGASAEDAAAFLRLADQTSPDALPSSTDAITRAYQRAYVPDTRPLSANTGLRASVMKLMEEGGDTPNAVSGQCALTKCHA